MTTKAHSEQQDQVGGFAPRRRGNRIKNQTPQAEQLSIDDIMKIQSTPQHDSGMAKTPVSVLQELLSRRGITPTYELVQIEGAIHEPTFRYRVSFSDKEVLFTALGAGRSKKEAKHAAAKSLIDKLTGVTISDQSGLSGLNANANGDGGSITPTILNENSNSYEEKVMGNPIGWLQEMCMARRWPPPNYETELEVGLPHERQFTIACTILNYREVGKGKSKKIAKRLAAHKMWTKLQENPLDQSQITQVLDEEGNDDNRVSIISRYADLKDANIPTLTNQQSFKVSHFHKTLKAASGKNLDKLQVSCLSAADVNFVQFLQDIATEQHFEVTYVDIEEKSTYGHSQCLVQLSSLPVAVCYGSGVNSKEAQARAAQNALEYLKMMTKKNLHA